MPSSASASDVSANPLVAIQAHEQKEMQRAEAAKHAVAAAESAAFEKMEKESMAEETKYKEGKQAELKAFAQKEPAEILKQGQSETESELKNIDATFASKKDALVKDVMSDFLASAA